MLIFKPRYFDDFSCLADRCDYTCCQGWGIPVDEAAYSRFVELNADYILDSIEDIEGGRKMHFDERGKCQLLSANGLCTVVLNEGLEYLCHICDTFPRFAWHRGDMIELGVSNACEATLQILMKEPTPLSFVIEEYEPREASLATGYKYHGDYRNISIDILQTQEIPLEKRICIFYLFTDMYSKDKEKAKNVFSNINALRAYAENLNKSSISDEDRFGWFKKIFQNTHNEGEQVEAFRKVLGCKFPPEDAEVDSHTKDQWPLFLERWNELESFWENVFVNAIYVMGEASDNFQDCALLLVLEHFVRKYAMFLLWIARGGKLDDRDVIRLTVYYARIMEHNYHAGLQYVHQFRDADWDERAWIMSMVSE